jgi:SAM-dependent methyltransferase
VISALRMYGDGLRGGNNAGRLHRARLNDGTYVPLPLERYLSRADATDERLLDGLLGPVLDVGCGPGRHLHALAARGVFALGVDISPVAVELAVEAGGRAMVGDIFDEVPASGRWRSALLLDGNIGIGGSPVRLLARIGALLEDAGELLVELEPPGTSTRSTQARLERDGIASAWFPWARVAAPAIVPIACASGFRAAEIWPLSERWFARLHRNRPGLADAWRRPSRRSARVGSVP